jgi:hypothetical protein
MKDDAAWRLDEVWVQLQLEGAPEGLDAKACVRALARGLFATRRLRRLVAGGRKPAGAATVEVHVERHDVGLGSGHRDAAPARPAAADRSELVAHGPPAPGAED